MNRSKKPQSPMGTLRFVLIAIVFMLLADHFIFNDTRNYIESAKTKPIPNPVEKTVKIVELPPPTKVMPPNGADYFEMIPMIEGPAIETIPDTIKEPKVIENTVVPPKGQKAKIAIVIDDVGMDIKRSKQAVNLPAPITLALLPYAPRVREFATEGKKAGHTLIIHVPMEATDSTVNIGSMGLKQNMNTSDIQNEMDKMFSSFEGYEGINNHMGSRLTQDDHAMADVMKVLSNHNLFFLDSKTSANSVAEYEAARAGLKFAARDVFLDHQDTPEFVNGALKKTEALALSRGYAIAIGHPKDHTLSALKSWIPTLESKGIELVSVKELLSQSEGVDMFPEEQEATHAQQIPHSNPSQEPEGVDGDSLPKEEEITDEDLFNQNINEVFGNDSSSPPIELHPLLPQQPLP